MSFLHDAVCCFWIMSAYYAYGNGTISKGIISSWEIRIYRIVAESLVGKSLVNLLFWVFSKKVWWINRSAKRLLIVSTNLDGFGLLNHMQMIRQICQTFPCQTFLLYGIKFITVATFKDLACLMKWHNLVTALLQGYSKVVTI